MILATYEKQPVEAKDYDVDYSPWLTQISDSIDVATSTVVCITDATDTSLLIDQTLAMATSIKLWMRGGTSGNKYKVTLTVTTLGQRIDQCELVFKIKER